MITKERILEIFGIDGWAKLLSAFSEQAPASGEQAPATGETEQLKATLVDGTEVYVDKLEEGGLVQIMVEGQLKPAPVGEHELSDGTVIELDQSGLIVKITPKAVQEAAPVAPAMDEMSAKVAELQAKIDTFSKQEFAAKADLTGLFASVAEIKATQLKIVKVIDELTSAPKKAEFKTEDTKPRAWFNGK
jgi:hypothetical protein